jgi:hypothetical protein
MSRLWFGLLVRSFRARRSLVIHQNLAKGFEAFALGVRHLEVSRDWLAGERLAIDLTSQAVFR